MDVRSQFSAHISSLVQLNDSLLAKVKDLETDLGKIKKRHDDTKQLLVKNLKKSTKLSTECRGARDEAEKYKERIKLIVAKTKEKEGEWVKYAKSCQLFKSRCTCQDRQAKSLTQPDQFVLEEVTLQNGDEALPKPCTAVNSSKLSSTRNSLKRLRRLSPVGKKKIRYDNVTVYADDSQDSPEMLNRGKSSRLNQDKSFVDAKTIKLRKSDTTPQCALNNEQISPVILEPVSPVLNLEESNSPVINLNDSASPGSPVIVDLVGSSDSWSTLEMFAVETPAVAKKPRKLNILNEFKGDVSISEEKLGFSLPTLGGTEIQASPVEDKKGTPAVTIPTAPKDFKFEAVVRKKEDRLRLKGSDCPLCYRYYEACGLAPDEIKKLIGDLSRHRHMHGKSSNTPPGFWDMTITSGMTTQPETQKKPKKKNKYIRKD